MRETVLAVMAAGIGSRFGGGIKQLEPVGPGGEIIMDYSIYDAMEAGFDRVVFIIRRDLEKDFREVIGRRIEKVIPVDYAFQELDDLPEGYHCPPARRKPWGTGQAILCAKKYLTSPFLVINADDYYGKEGFQAIHSFMTDTMDLEGDVFDACMGGFLLKNTLCENGGVTRGVCQVGDDGILVQVQETYQLSRSGEVAEGCDEDGNRVCIPLDSHVSMNMWGLPPAFVEELERGFPKFLDSLKSDGEKAEYLLPRIIDRLVREGKMRVKVLETRDRWFGVTYREDKPAVIAAVRQLIESGVYKEKLF